jgi:hypothetical protein
MPVADSIHWKPLRDPHYVIVSLQPGQGGLRRVFVQQAVLLRVQALASAATKGPLLGLLLGHRWDCPITGARYLLIDSLAEGPPTVPDENTQSAILGNLLAQRQKDTSAECLGWYSAKRGVGSHISRVESAVHLARFQKPWQTALMVADGGRAGGFFQRDVLESRWFQAPFSEVTDPKAHAHAKKPTSIDWPEYLTADLVAPLIRPHAPLLKSPRPSEPAKAPRQPPAKRAPARHAPAKRGPSRIEAATQRIETASTRALGAVRVGVRRGASAAASAYGWTVAHVILPVVSTARESVEALRNAAERARVAQEPIPELATATPIVSTPATVQMSPSSAPVRSPSTSPVYRPTIPAARPAVAPPVERPIARPVRRSQPTPAILADVEDTTAGDSPYRYLALARREGFQVGAKLERGTPDRPETVWLLIEPASGLRLTLVTNDEGVREASLHCNLRTDDEALLRATPPEYRDVESRTIYVREACVVSLRARCRRLRATGKLEPDWKVAPSFHQQAVPAQSEQS